MLFLVVHRATADRVAFAAYNYARLKIPTDPFIHATIERIDPVTQRPITIVTTHLLEDIQEYILEELIKLYDEARANNETYLTTRVRPAGMSGFENRIRKANEELNTILKSRG